MKIGVLGAGRMTEAIVPHWLAAGHEVMIGGRTTAKAEQLAARLGTGSGSLREAAEFGDVIFLSVLYQGVESTLRAAGDALAGKVLLDCTNPVESERFTLVTEPGTSIAETIAAASGARVVKALNQVERQVWMTGARYDGEPLVVPIAGEADPKAVAEQLIRDAGAQPLDAGELLHARYLEAMAAVIIRWLAGGADPLSAFQLTVGSASSVPVAP
jgi:predicted dinucleotide-binding enzyme